MLKIFSSISKKIRNILSGCIPKPENELEKFYSVVKCIFYISPIPLGMIGFLLIDDINIMYIVDSLFNIVLMYTFGYSDTPPNIFIQLARWIAPLATASCFIKILSKIGINIHNYIVYIKGNSVAVYGKDSDKQEILAELGKKGIDGGETMVKAKRYILLDDEDTNMDFYHAHASELENHKVYMKTGSRNVLSSDKIMTFCTEETAARLFWKQQYIFDQMYKPKAIKQIVMIGFGKLGEQLLYWGLLNMIFSPTEKIEFHIFGDGEEFKKVHYGIAPISELIVFHDSPWYDEIPLIDNADLAIVVEQEQQMELLSKLLIATKRELFDVFATSANIIDLLDGSNRLRIFKWKEDAQKLSHIFDDDLLYMAKRINMRYIHLKYPNESETDKDNIEKWWKYLDTFGRYSNISAADYHEIRLKMLEKMGIEPNPANINESVLDNLAELEHIRWCRYYFLNNWKYDTIKNESNRTHPDLRLYSELTEEEKEKDRENIRTLLSVEIDNENIMSP